MPLLFIMPKMKGCDNVGIFDKLGEAIFDAQWYLFEERPIRKSMRKFNRDMDKAINSLNRAMENIPERDNMSDDESVTQTEETSKQAQKFKKRRFI